MLVIQQIVIVLYEFIDTAIMRNFLVLSIELTPNSRVIIYVPGK